MREATVTAQWHEANKPRCSTRHFFATIDTYGKPNTKISKRAVLWIIYTMTNGMPICQTLDYSRHTLGNWQPILSLTGGVTCESSS